MAEAVQAQAGNGTGFTSEDQRRALNQARTTKERQKQALYLQREHILSQRTSNPARRSALAAALEQVEAQISAIE